MAPKRVSSRFSGDTLENTGGTEADNTALCGRGSKRRLKPSCKLKLAPPSAQFSSLSVRCGTRECVRHKRLGNEESVCVNSPSATGSGLARFPQKS
jgi:hypothetical protein